MPTKNLKFAVVCSSNMNRSMEAHRFMSKKKFDVQSFGTGTVVKLPGPAANKPNVYSFDWKYEDILSELTKKDQADKNITALERSETNLQEMKNFGPSYVNNGVLNMLDRNRRIKERPQRFQESKDRFHVVISLEERVYDQIMEDFNTREPESYEPVHIINIDIPDNHEEATIGAFIVCELAKQLQDSDDLDNEVDELLQEFEEKTKRTIMHTVQFY